MSPTRFQKTRPFLINASGFTLGQLLAALLVITVVFFFVAAISYPVFVPTKGRNRPPSCVANIKLINLGMLQYIEDYDDRFPPCAVSVKNDRVLFGWAATHNQQAEAALSNAAVKIGATTVAQATGDRIIGSYVKNGQIFRCPSVPQNSGPVSFMYNDLAAEVAQKDFAVPDKTVLVCDGENLAGNVGHAYDPSLTPAPPYFFSDGAVAIGTTLQTAPTRHNDGANYGYADGHVKWSKPESIFFPSRFSASRSHKDAKTGQILGPDPAKLNTDKVSIRNGTVYSGTFHIK